MGFDRRRHFSLVVKKRVDRGARKKLENRFQNFLSSAHSIQPVVDNRDLHIIGAGNIAQSI